MKNKLISFITAFVLFWGVVSLSHAITAPKYRIITVYLFNFTRFMEWPDSAYDNPSATFQICVFGRDRFKLALDVAIEKETVGKRPITMRRLTQIDKITNCQVLYIGSSEKHRVANILNAVKNHPVLTVSNLPDFVDNGGMVRFYENKSRIRIEINPDALREVNLYASSKLLRIAKISRVPLT